MPYAPRPGSKTALAIAYISTRAGARTDEIAEATEIDRNSLASLLGPAVTAGVLLTCKVEQPGKPPMNEYRVACGASLQPFKEFHFPNKPAEAPKPAATEAPPIKVDVSIVGSKKQPAPKRATPDQIRMVIDQDAAVTLHTEDGFSLELTPAQTLAVGDFFACTEQLWRP